MTAALPSADVAVEAIDSIFAPPSFLDVLARLSTRVRVVQGTDGWDVIRQVHVVNAGVFRAKAGVLRANVSGVSFTHLVIHRNFQIAMDEILWQSIQHANLRYIGVGGSPL
jgi:hypothetical protein